MNTTDTTTTTPSVPVPVVPPDRGWNTTFTDARLISQNKHGTALDANITIRTRLTDLSTQVDDKLFQPYIYQLSVRVTRLDRECPAIRDASFLMARIFCVASDDHSKEIRKQDKPIMQGDLEFAMTSAAIDKKSQGECFLQGHTKIKFTDVSYHHQNKYFCWRIVLYVPTDMTRPLLVKTSPPFKVYSRKKQEKTSGQGVKRKHKDMQDIDDISVTGTVVTAVTNSNGANVLQHGRAHQFADRQGVNNANADGHGFRPVATAQGGATLLSRTAAIAATSPEHQDMNNAQPPAKVRIVPAQRPPAAPIPVSALSAATNPSANTQHPVPQPQGETMATNNKALPQQNHARAPDFSDFSNKLHALIDFHRQLDHKHRCKLLEYTIKQIQQIDPVISSRIMFASLQNMFFEKTGPVAATPAVSTHESAQKLVAHHDLVVVDDVQRV